MSARPPKFKPGESARDYLRKKQDASNPLPRPGGAVETGTAGSGPGASSVEPAGSGTPLVDHTVPAPPYPSRVPARSGVDNTTAREENAIQAAATAGDTAMGLGVRDVPGPGLTRKQQFIRFASSIAGRVLAKRMTKAADAEKKIAVTTATGKGVKQAVVSTGVLVAVLGAVRGFAPDYLWDPEMDAEMVNRLSDALDAIVGAVAAVSFLWGVASNIWKHRAMVKNGVSLKEQRK